MSQRLDKNRDASRRVTGSPQWPEQPPLGPKAHGVSPDKRGGS